MRRRDFVRMAAIAAAGYLADPVGGATGTASLPAGESASKGGAGHFVLDMVHRNPGEPYPQTAFLNPGHLASWGYSGQVLLSVIEGVPTFDSIAPGMLPRGGDERAWAEKTANQIQEQIARARAAGIRCYAWMQLLVFPKAIVEKFKDQICDRQGRIDIARPFTQQLLRAQLEEIFTRFPELDGLVVRTGEIYLKDLPYHTSNGSGQTTLIQANTAILNGEQSHLEILHLLREEVCVKLDRNIFYRTWDFGNNFHTNPRYYLAVTDAIGPHPKLVFSVKHQAGDFLRLTPFNPTLMIGKHRQIVETECQLEVYGKGAHPYYSGQGVIGGWEEYAWLMKPCEAKGLRDIAKHPLFAGVWTWSRGGGWDGPYIKDEFWCALNARVASQFAQYPDWSEEKIFAEVTRFLGLNSGDAARFRELCLLSSQAVLRGQVTALGTGMDLWWTRDDKLGSLSLGDFISKGVVEESIAEKANAVDMWKQIERLSTSVRFPLAETNTFVQTSSIYGRMKYTVIQHGWTVMLLGQLGDQNHLYDKPRIHREITAYDAAWKVWQEWCATQPSCATLYKDFGFDNAPGLGAAVEHYRSEM